MKTKSVFFASILLLLMSCQNNAVKDAISAQLRQYPETKVQDIYKSFCQDNLGPEHLVPDPEAAKSYLLSELEMYRADLDSARYEKPASRYIPVGDKGNYVRVDLSIVLDSLCDADRLLDAFVRSANEGKTVTAEQWKEKWKEVAAVIKEDFRDIPDADKDLAAIDSLMAEGQLIMHHSRAFSLAYHPHYRIVAKDILEELIERPHQTKK